jgi:hypothetical protein
MVTWSDRRWEERYQYSRLLSTRIAKKTGDSLDISDDLLLSHFPLEKTSEGALTPEMGAPLPPAFGNGGTAAMAEAEQTTLLEILDKINERYGLELDDRHVLFMEQVAQQMTDEADVQRSAGNNSSERFINEVLVERLVNAIMLTADDNYEFAEQVVNKPEIAKMIEGPLGEFVWRVAREKYRSRQAPE